MKTLNNLDIDFFIRTYVTKRQESLLHPDLEKTRTLLEERINGRNALVIGGAGASIPELTLLSAIFRRKMLAAFVLTILAIALAAGYLANLLSGFR